MTTEVSPDAGRLIEPSRRLDVGAVLAAYADGVPDPREPAQRVQFGTSGHRGSAVDLAFNCNHVLAITQAVCLHRIRVGIDGPLFLGIDTHALSRPALETALEVFAANGVAVLIDEGDGYTPTPVISHAIINYNRARMDGMADGVVLSPSHNPPGDGGFKYNPPSGGPADAEVTGWIERAANRLLESGLNGVRRLPIGQALASGHVSRHDYASRYIDDLAGVIDMAAIRASGVTLGADPLGGASVNYWPRIFEQYGLAGTVTNSVVDPAFGFMTADWDGRIRMDCSSPYAMRSLIALRDRFDVAFANDTDADRHGIVTRVGGLMPPNHYLAAAIAYVFDHRADWPRTAGIGKTMVSSSIIDRIAARLDRRLLEVPVGFKWFVQGLQSGALGFAGEESAVATLLRRDGSVWTTDKDGLALGLLAAEITAVTGRDPGRIYDALTEDLGVASYERIDAPATRAQKAVLEAVTPEQIDADRLGGEAIREKLIAAPGNGARLGGVKVIAKNAWFAARPSGTEDVYKIYAESFLGEAHLRQVQAEAEAIVGALI